MTSTHPIKTTATGMYGPSNFGAFNYPPTNVTPFGMYNPTYPVPPVTMPGTGAGFYPPMPPKFPPTTGMPGTGYPTTVPPTGEYNVFEPEPWTNLPPYSYRNWPTNVGNIFGPTNPMMNPMMPSMHNPMMPTTMGAMPPAVHPNQTLYNMNFRPANWLEFYTLTNPVRMIEHDGSRMLFLAYDLRGFKPEEINVTMHKGDRSIVVEANYDFKDTTHHIKRNFSRKFVLPDYLKTIDLNKIDLHSSLNINGMLMIEAMLPRMTPEEMTKWGGEMHTHNMPGMPGYNPFTSMVTGYNYPITCRPVNP